MNEKEKLLNGLPYDSSYIELVEDRERCKELCFEFNNQRPREVKRREKIMREIIGEIKGEFYIEPNFWCDYGYNISIGDNFYINHNCVILDCAKVTFGDNVFIAPNCGFYTACHPIDKDERNGGAEIGKPIKIGNDVWIGGGVTVLPGVNIGDNVVIGGGSVVVSDIPSNVVAVGNPCRVLRPIGEEDKGRFWFK